MDSHNKETTNQNKNLFNMVLENDRKITAFEEAFKYMKETLVKIDTRFDKFDTEINLKLERINEKMDARYATREYVNAQDKELKIDLESQIKTVKAEFSPWATGLKSVLTQVIGIIVTLIMGLILVDKIIK